MKRSRINCNWSVRFLNNWHSVHSLDKITTRIWCLSFPNHFCFVLLVYLLSKLMLWLLWWQKCCSHWSIWNNSHSCTGATDEIQICRDSIWACASVQCRAAVSLNFRCCKFCSFDFLLLILALQWSQHHTEHMLSSEPQMLRFCNFFFVTLDKNLLWVLFGSVRAAASGSVWMHMSEILPVTHLFTSHHLCTILQSTLKG